jgi:hypothetical protein
LPVFLSDFDFVFLFSDNSSVLLLVFDSLSSFFVALFIFLKVSLSDCSFVFLYIFNFLHNIRAFLNNFSFSYFDFSLYFPFKSFNFFSYFFSCCFYLL